MTGVVRSMSLEEEPAGGAAAATGPSRAGRAGEPGSSGGGGGAAGHRGVTPGMQQLPVHLLPESMQGRLERPKLGSEDIKFLRKRKLALDEAFEAHAGSGGGGDGVDG